MKKVFISQPMRGLTDEQILKAREEIKERVSQKVNDRMPFAITTFKMNKNHIEGVSVKSFQEAHQSCL